MSIISGFGEIGNEELEKEVTTIAKKAGIRVLGPNCLGVYDSQTGVDMLFLPKTKVNIPSLLAGFKPNTQESYSMALIRM